MVLTDSFDDRMYFFEVRVLTTGAIGGVGEHGDFWLIVSIGFVGGGGIFDDAVEFISIGLFVNATIGNSENLVLFLTDETAREELRAEC